MANNHMKRYEQSYEKLFIICHQGNANLKKTVRYNHRAMLLLLSLFSRVWLYDPKDGSPPGSSVLGILQARTLKWVAISFSNASKWRLKVKSLSRVRLFATPWTASLPGSSVHGILQARVLEWSATAFSTIELCEWPKSLNAGKVVKL